jgi:hypothetical protein
VGGTVSQFWGISDTGWIAIGAISTILAAVATLGATIAAIWLGLRQSKPSVVITAAGVRVLAGAGYDPQVDRYFCVTVVNQSAFAIVITNITIKVGYIRRRYAVHFFNGGPFSAAIPHSLQPQHSVLEGKNSIDFLFPKKIPVWWFKIHKRSIKLRVHLATNHLFQRKIEGNFINLVADKRNAFNSTKLPELK